MKPSRYCECGKPFCYVAPDGKWKFCPGACEKIHNDYHLAYLDYLAYENYQSSSYPDYDPYAGSFQSSIEVNSFMNNKKVRFCSSCEQQINVTDHICKQMHLSKDVIDVLKSIPTKG